MSVYVGIDVHRKRSQVAVVAEDGKVQLNKNTVNGTEPLLRLIGDLPAGTPVAFEAAFGWGWLLRLLEDYGFDPHLVHPLQCKAIASARLKNDRYRTATFPQLTCRARDSSRSPDVRRSASAGRRSLAANLIAAETGHTGLNQSPAFSSLPIFDISPSRSWSALAGSVACYDMPILQLGLHCSEKTR